MQDHFSPVAAQYEQFRPRYSPAMINDVRFALPTKAPKDAFLDVACGTGQLLFPLSVDFDVAIGVDLSSKQVEQAQKKVP